MPDETKTENEENVMHRRQITLQDGRYLLFYTFGRRSGAPQSSPTAAAKEQGAVTRPDPEPKLETVEERRV